MLHVLPRALLTAAAELRALDISPDVVVASCGAPRLDDALVEFCSAWSGAGLAEDAAATAALLVASAERYADVDALLVPRSLR